ncbi:hypothetical protein K3495_g12809 [Podosphaera aphanis]|nr:hypothetical protein K3495_g12809 [Podosphaera aphanis]
MFPTKKDLANEPQSKKTTRSGNSYGAGSDNQDTGEAHQTHQTFGATSESLDSRMNKLENQFSRLEATVDERFANFEKSLDRRFNTINDSLATLLRRSNSKPNNTRPESPAESQSSIKAEPTAKVDAAAAKKTDKGKEKETAESSRPTYVEQTTTTVANPSRSSAGNVKVALSNSQNLYLPDGSINLHRVTDYPSLSNLTPKERQIKEIWPEIKLLSEVFYEDFETTTYKNRAFLKPEWKLTKAKDDTFAKLRLIQSAFYTSLVPYHLWPQRLAPEMDGDFHLVRRLIDQFNISWVETIEGIIKVLDNHQALHKPVPAFARLMPCQGENYEDYSWRIRDAYFRLPLNERGSTTVRGILIENIRTYMPSVWSFLHDSHTEYSNSEIVDRAVQRAGHVADSEIEKQIFSMTKPRDQLSQLNNAARPGLSIVDPASDDHNVAATTEEAFVERPLICYTCGKTGHTSPNCNNKRQVTTKRPDSSTKGQRITIKGFLFNEGTKVANFMKSSGKKPNEKGRHNHKSYLIDQPAEEPTPLSPMDRFDQDDNIDFELDQLEQEMLQED